MDLDDWTEGAWYGEMARVGRELYTLCHVGGPASETIARLIYGMEIRAAGKLGDAAQQADLLTPPEHMVRAHLTGELQHQRGPALRPAPAQTPDHDVFARVPYAWDPA